MIGRLMIGGLAASLVLSLAGGALAALPPQYYEQARTEALDVFTIEIANVTPPGGDWGDCSVSGTVIEVERGSAFKTGQSATVAVACSTGASQPPLGGRLWIGLDRLNGSKRLKAWTNGGAVARDQVELFGRR